MNHARSTPRLHRRAECSQGNASTGALCTCIGFGSNVVVGPSLLYGTPPAGVNGGFVDDSSGVGANSTYVYIGGGRSVTSSGVNPAGQAGVNPYTAGFVPTGAGNGGSRDGGAGPATGQSTFGSSTAAQAAAS